MSTCPSKCGNNTWCTDWSSSDSIDCSCTNTSYFSTNEDGSSCIACLGSCPSWSLKKLQAAVIYLPLLSGVIALAILIIWAWKRRVFAQHLRSYSQVTQALNSTRQEIAQAQAELDMSLEQLATSREYTRTLQAKVDPLQFNKSQLVASGMKPWSPSNQLC